MAASKNAGEILRTVEEDGRRELDRASMGLAFSGFAAGLNISFGAIAMAVVGAQTGEIGIPAMLLYPIGFLIVILGRAQLFTENTVTPVVVALSDYRQIPNMLRLWVVVLAFNVLGAIVFAAATIHVQLLEPRALELLLGEVAGKMKYGFTETMVRGIFGGWLVALLAWLIAASRDTISQIFFVWGLTFLIPAAHLTHSVAGSSEVMMSVFAGNTGWGEFAGGFLLPTTLGNILGGVFLVTILNYGQVIGSRRRTQPEKAARAIRRQGKQKEKS